MRKEEKKVEGKVWVVSYFPLENYSYGDTVRVAGIFWRKSRRIQENVRVSLSGRLWMNTLESECEPMMVSFRIDRSQPCITRCDWLARS